MNIGKLRQYCSRSILVSVLLVIAFIHPSSAETRSGFWTLVSPASDPRMSQVDFSEFTPFCHYGAGVGQCSLSVADVDFSSYRTARAPGGILFDSALGVALQTEYLSGKTITLDREGLFYLDSMMKKRGLTAPVGGYADSCPLFKNVYFVRTSENRFATMIKVGEYIGGFNREYYYWAYRPEADSIMHKATLYELPESLSITVDAFSGRPNPVFTLRDSAGIAEIVRQIYVSVNTLLDSSIKRTSSIPCNQGLGYRNLAVTGMYGPDNPPNPYMPMLEICNGGITYYKVSPFSSSMQPRVFNDPGRRLEKLVVRVCCGLDLTVNDSYGVVRFCDIIPDSLQDFNRIFHNRLTGLGEKIPQFRRMGGTRMIYSVHQAGRVRAALYDMRGRLVAQVVDRHHLPGEYLLDLEKMTVGPGVYLLDVHATSAAGRQMVPLTGLTAHHRSRLTGY